MKRFVKHALFISPVLFGVVLCLATVGFYVTFGNLTGNAAATKAKPKTYAECRMTPGSYDLLGYPHVCMTMDGQKFTQEVPLMAPVRSK